MVTSKAETSNAADKLAITPTTVQDTNDKSDSGPDGSSDEMPKKVEMRKSSSAVSASKKPFQDNGKAAGKKKEKSKDENATGDKSERSSSPAFDSDEDSSGNGNGNPPVQALQPPAGCKKRAPSIAGLLVNTALTTYPASKLNPSSIIQENLLPITKSSSSHLQGDGSGRHLSLLDEDISLNPKEARSLSQPISPETIEPISVKKEERIKSLTKTILPPPSDFKTSPIVNRSRPQSVISDAGFKDLTDDVVSRMDGADLRFMDESSGMLPSPSNEGLGSNFPHHRPHGMNNSQSNNIATNPSLLQKALIQATAQSTQPSPKVLIKTGSSRQSISPAEKGSSSPPAETHIKFSTEVSVTNHNDNKPITTIINKVTNLDGMEARDEIEKVTNDVSNTNNESALKADETNKLMPNKVEQNGKSNKDRRMFLQNIRKRLRLDGKKKAGPLLGIAGNRQKSKSENRARKAFRTISFILGAFVICWTVSKKNKIRSTDKFKGSLKVKAGEACSPVAMTDYDWLHFEPSKQPLGSHMNSYIETVTTSR